MVFQTLTIVGLELKENMLKLIFFKLLSEAQQAKDTVAHIKKWSIYDEVALPIQAGRLTAPLNSLSSVT